MTITKLRKEAEELLPKLETGESTLAEAEELVQAANSVTTTTKNAQDLVYMRTQFRGEAKAAAAKAPKPKRGRPPKRKFSKEDLEIIETIKLAKVVFESQNGAKPKDDIVALKFCVEQLAQLLSVTETQPENGTEKVVETEAATKSEETVNV